MKILPAPLAPVATDSPVDDILGLYKLSEALKVSCIISKSKGLSAVQVGVPWRLFVISNLPPRLAIDEDLFGCFVNCEYEPIGDDMVELVEGCTSIVHGDGHLRLFRTHRYAKVRVVGLRLVGMGLEPFDEELGIREGGAWMQHEIDHQVGVYPDRGDEIIVWG